MAKVQDSSLYEALLLLKDEKEVHKFLKDLCTPQEISVLKERWRICQLLNKGELSYRAISKETKASLATIGRVARFLKDEPHKGYKTVLKKLEQKDS